jgi:mannosyltransferase
MATVMTARRDVPPTAEVRQRRWHDRIPLWASVCVFLLVLTGISAYLRTRYLSGQFWIDEALTTGISSHPLSAIPGVLRHDGSPPLFYLLLHFWITAFGASESATHSLSLLFGLLTVPVGMWAGWSLFGRRAGVIAAILFATNAWLTQYAQETRMYELMALLGLIATTAFIHAFLHRRRKYLIVFAITLALMLYTHVWGVFFGVGAVLALIPVWFASADRRGLVRDAVMAFVGAGILFLPWLPNFIYQAGHTGAPWASSPRFGAPILISRDLLGGDRVTAALLLGAVAGLVPLFLRRRRADASAAAASGPQRAPDQGAAPAYAKVGETPAPVQAPPTALGSGPRAGQREITLLWMLIVLPVGTLVVAWLASQISPAFVSRYFAPILASLLLLAAWGCARAGIVGWAAIVLSIVFVLHTSVYVHPYKSDMRDVGGEMASQLHPGDLVIVGQPEAVPLAWYYLPEGLRYASTIGPVSDPTYMNWVDALSRLQNTRWRATLRSLLAGLPRGKRLLFVRPITEGASNWEAPWTQLVRRRSAQWGAVLASDPQLREVAVAPHVYRGPACCVPDEAVLYQKLAP